MAGYSGKPLVAKLGIKPGARVALLNAPAGYAETLGELPADVKLFRSAKPPLDFVQCFEKNAARLEARIAELRPAIVPDGMIWISWPKKSSGVATDVTEDVVRGLALAAGLVDVKVCAVDDTWSGLKLVIPRKLRPATK